MWHNKIKLLLVTLLLSVSGSLFAQSQLPPCPSSINAYRHNCTGTYTFANGNKYVGEWRNGSFNGQGTEYAANGSIINQGIWQNFAFVRPEKINTQPNLTASVNSNPTQEVKSMLPACRGHVAGWDNCYGLWGRYNGEWRNGQYSGQGAFVHANNSRYVGEFKRHFYNGLGTLYSSDGSIINQGLWVNDVFVRAEKIFVTNIDIAEELQKTNKNIPWSDRVSQVVAGSLNKWLEESGVDLKEIPSPAFPPALKLSQEVWESNKEFENRVAVERTKRQKEIDAIQADYKSKVDQRNAQIQQLNTARIEKERGLSAKRKEYLGYALAAINLQISSKAVSFDQERSILYVDLSINNGKAEKYAYQNAPIEIRKTALTNLSNLSFKPEFFVTDTGEFGIKNIAAQVGQEVSLGSLSQSDSIAQPLRVATIDVPITSQVPLTQQSALVVDRNQVEQILYRDENESLRKRLEDLRRSQEQTLAEQSKKASEEIAKLRAEAEALKLQQSNTQPSRLVNYGRTLVAHALVIGNSAYAGSSRLPNPVNDAKAMTQKLRALGFIVTEATDTNRTSLVSALSKFSQTAAKADITLLFYAGHGVQISGTNYMLPIDLNLNDLSQAPLQGVSLNSVIEQYLPGKTKLVFLDACRDNPLMQVSSRGVTKGLAPINVSEGTLIAYATKDGQVAQDGIGGNSPFTSALLAHIDDPDDIAVVLRKVRENVMLKTNGTQQPWEYGSLTGGALVLSAIKPK
jgi:hypothetical protein